MTRVAPSVAALFGNAAPSVLFVDREMGEAIVREPLALWRGVNIEGWLDDRLLPPAQRPLFFGPADAVTSSMRLNEPVADNPDDQNLILTFH